MRNFESKCYYVWAVAMILTPYLFVILQQWKFLVAPTLLIYMLLVHSLRDRRARNLERRFSPAGRASFCRLSTADAQAILKDLTELEFPKLFGFSIIFALFKAGSPDALLTEKKSFQTKPTSAYHQAIDIRNTERFLSAHCYRAARRYRNSI